MLSKAAPSATRNMPGLRRDGYAGLCGWPGPDRRLPDARCHGGRREVFGYNRSIEAVQAATADGFDATENLDEALTRAADGNALIVLAVPVPALPQMLGRVRDLAPRCPLTDVTSVKSCVLDEVRSVGLLDRFVGGHPMAAPRTPVGLPAMPCSLGRPGSSAWTTTSTPTSGWR